MIPNFYQLERQMLDEAERVRAGAARQRRVDLAREKEPRSGDRFPWRARRHARTWAGR